MVADKEGNGDAFSCVLVEEVCPLFLVNHIREARPSPANDEIYAGVLWSCKEINEANWYRVRRISASAVAKIVQGE